MIRRPELSRGLFLALAHPGLAFMGDPEDDEEEEEEEKKREEDEEEEENDGEEAEVPWQVTVPDFRGVRVTQKRSLTSLLPSCRYNES